MSRRGAHGGGMGGRRHIQLGNGRRGQHLGRCSHHRHCHHDGRDYTDEESEYTDDEESDYTDGEESEYSDEELERRGGRRGGQGRQENYLGGQQGGWGGPPQYGGQQGGYGGPEQYEYQQGDNALRYRGVNHWLAAELARRTRNEEERVARMEALEEQIQARRQRLDALRARDAQRAQEDEDPGDGRQEDNAQEENAYVQWLAQRIAQLEARLAHPEENYGYGRQEDNAPEEHNAPPMPEGWGVDDGQWTPEQLAHMAEVTRRMIERGVPGW